MGKSEKKGEGGQEGNLFDLSVKISGKSLRQLMAIRAYKEKKTGKITSATEIVREAIEYLYSISGGNKWKKQSLQPTVPR